MSGLVTGAMRLAGTVASAGGAPPRFLILTYHRVFARRDPLLPHEVDLAGFEWQVEMLVRLFTVLPMREAVQRMKSRSLPARTVVLTFDDGYANNAELALPVLRKWGVAGTFFVATGFLDGATMFNDVVIEAIRGARGEVIDISCLDLGELRIDTESLRRRAIAQILARVKYLPLPEREAAVAAVAARAGGPAPQRLMMTPEQVRDLAEAGMEIGAHTVNHPILCGLSDAAAQREIVQGRERLRDITGQGIVSFAYPNGRPGVDFERRHVDLVRDAGFTGAVTTAWGCATARDDPYQLPRIAPWDETPGRFWLRLMKAYFQRDGGQLPAAATA